MKKQAKKRRSGVMTKKRASVMADLEAGKLSRIDIAAKYRIHPTTVVNWERYKLSQDTGEQYNCQGPGNVTLAKKKGRRKAVKQARTRRIPVAHAPEANIGDMVNKYLLNMVKAAVVALAKTSRQ